MPDVISTESSPLCHTISSRFKYATRTLAMMQPCHFLPSPNNPYATHGQEAHSGPLHTLDDSFRHQPSQTTSGPFSVSSSICTLANITYAYLYRRSLLPSISAVDHLWTSVAEPALSKHTKSTRPYPEASP